MFPFPFRFRNFSAAVNIFSEFRYEVPKRFRRAAPEAKDDGHGVHGRRERLQARATEFEIE